MPQAASQSLLQEHHAKQPSGSKFESYFTDELSHLYTLIIQPDGRFQVLVDNTEVIGGNLNADLEPAVRPPKQVDDPNEKKPTDWDDREKISDPDATKPDDWCGSACAIVANNLIAGTRTRRR
jgi:calnexin